VSVLAASYLVLLPWNTGQKRYLLRESFNGRPPWELAWQQSQRWLGVGSGGTVSIGGAGHDGGVAAAAALALEQDVAGAGPQEIPDLRTPEAWRYRAVVNDPLARRVVGWSWRMAFGTRGDAADATGRCTHAVCNPVRRHSALDVRSPAGSRRGRRPDPMPLHESGASPAIRFLAVPTARLARAVE
jgi:transposase InsO family protein